MSKSSFDKNGLDNSETHRLQYTAFVLTVFDIYSSNQLKFPITFIAF